MAPLPVSGLDVALRPPDGSDELLVRETTGSAVTRALVLLDRLSPEGNVADLTVTDFEVLLLRLRAQVLGEALYLGFGCPLCREPVEVSFQLADFLAGVRPRRPVNVLDAPGRPGWYLLEGIAFRLPTVGDQAAVVDLPDAVARLVGRCIEPPRPAARVRARIERAMAAMAPEVSAPLAGRCPSCGQTVEAPLHVTRVVIGELARESAYLHDEVDLIARTYHWPEADILKLPRRRRQAYADRIRRAA